MENNFKLEIINPEEIIFSSNVKTATFPSYEGDMSILKNHIPIITFLRPGLIRIKKNGENNEEFFIQDGTVEFFNDILVILSSSAISTKNLSKQFIDNLNAETNEKLSKKDINDRERYILNHQLDVLKEISA